MVWGDQGGDRAARSYRTAIETVIGWAILSRFVTGERPTLRSDTVDRLCDYLNLELRTKQRKKKR